MTRIEQRRTELRAEHAQRVANRVVAVAPRRRLLVEKVKATAAVAAFVTITALLSWACHSVERSEQREREYQDSVTTLRVDSSIADRLDERFGDEWRKW